MTKRYFLFLALAAVVGVGWFALSSNDEPEEAHSGDPAPVEPQPANEGEAVAAVRDVDRESASGTDYLTFAENDLKLQPGELDEFLSFDVNIPQRWAVACDLTEDPGLLETALSRFPDDKGLLTRLLVNDFASGDVESTAQRMLKSHPDQSIADYALAARALKSGDSETAFRHLADALTKEPPVLLTSDEVLLRRAALENTGLSPAAAGLAAFKPDYDQKSFSLMMSVADLVNRQDSRDMAFAELGVGLSEHMRQAGAMNFGNEIMALAF